ncbi:hypothetical protein [Parvularcula lutaonensis]|uniref:Chemotaxis protein MotC n=1 Tax=Parvularcula lutaonensis TaxID=491923 RepID=A0ABV7MD73_9PROT|nr:hypothetical protein [Parvularcula lutaonensis]GGY40628.1 hypothetical protein GCM10007148_06400 [Parvularcula lutaonensis]
MKQAILASFLALASATAPFSAAKAQVERANFDSSPFSLGTLTENEGALGRDLWDGATAEEIADQLRNVPTSYEDPVKRLILRRVLLSPGNGPDGADADLAGLKLLRAAEAGYVMEAGALAELMPGLVVQPSLSRIVAMRDLYKLQFDQACARGANLREGRQQPFFVRLRAFCYIHAGETPAAELTISLAREEGVLSPGDEQMYANLFARSVPNEFPRSALQYAAYRKLGGLFAPTDIPDVTPAVAAAIVYDRGLSTPTRSAALVRAAREDLVPARDLADAAASLEGEEVASVIATIAAQPAGSFNRSQAIGEALVAAKQNPDLYLVLTKIYGQEIASMRPDAVTMPYATELALSSLIIRNFATAEAWIQAVAAENTIGAERAFLNLAKLYSYLRPGAAQRLAGAIGERLPDPPVPAIRIPDALAQAQASADLPTTVDRAITAAASGARGSMLLAALATSGVRASGELAAVRDTVGAALYKRAEANRLAADAAFQRQALESVGSLREEVINKEAYVPRLKPIAAGQ